MSQVDSPQPQEGSPDGAATAVEFDESMFETVLEKVPKARRDTVSEALQALTDEVLKGVPKWDKNVIRSLDNLVAEIDRKLSEQLAAIMHHAEFQKLEGSWRGLHHLVMNSETGTTLRIKLINASKDELKKDFEKAVEFDQSHLFKQVYEEEFGTPGGEPFGALIGDFEFENHPEDISLLEELSNVGSASHCPFISAASPQLFNPEWDSFEELAKPRDLAKMFDSVEYAQWKSFRESDASRYAVLTMPRTLARLPYGEKTKKVDAFQFEEVDGDKQVPHDQYCWMNTAYVLGTRLTDAFAKHGWCTAIRGAEGGGKVEGLPSHTFKADDGGVSQKCPTEIAITDRRENELSNLGFLPLCHYKNTDYAVFFGAQTAKKPTQYEGKDGVMATENEAIMCRLPYNIAAGRINHYLKMIARDKIGSFMEAEDCEEWLNGWIANYVLADSKGGQTAKSQYPLAEARIKVEPIPGKPGAYNAIAHLRPWLQMEELRASIRMVSEIPIGE